MSESVIKVEGLYKKFSKSLKRSMVYGTVDSVKTMVGLKTNDQQIRKGEFWALQNINFNLFKGETLGIIGLNGSGKSTLLRVLTGIFPPDAGKVTLTGRVGSLIAVGAGFHPHMTGKENIYLNGIIMGMSRKEIDQKFDEIVRFAEIEDFINAPVATYSSGMKVRLGFSVAIHGEPEIMLVDEILSVGDLGFRNKSLRKMHEYSKNNSVIFVSHALEQVRVICDRVIVLDKGQIVYVGDTLNGILKYEELSEKNTYKAYAENKAQGVKPLFESDGDTINYLEQGILNGKSIGSTSSEVEVGRSIEYYCDFEIRKSLDEIFFTFAVVTESNQIAFWLNSNDTENYTFKFINTGKYRINIHVPAHHLNTGIYFINFSIKDGKTVETYQRSLKAVAFRVTEPRVFSRRGLIHVEENWVLNNLK